MADRDAEVTVISMMSRLRAEAEPEEARAIREAHRLRPPGALPPRPPSARLQMLASAAMMLTGVALGSVATVYITAEPRTQPGSAGETVAERQEAATAEPTITWIHNDPQDQRASAYCDDWVLVYGRQRQLFLLRRSNMREPVMEARLTRDRPRVVSEFERRCTS